MKFLWKLILIIAMAILYVGYAHPDWIVDPTFAKASANYIDSCAAGTHIQGYTDSGGAICTQDPTGCPYAEHVPLGPKCDSLAPIPATIPSISSEQQPLPDFSGK